MARQSGGECFAFEADVANETTLAAMFEAARRRWGRIDVLHYNVGVSIAGGDAPLNEITEDAVDRIAAVDLRGPGACQDVTQSETANAADPSPAAAVEGDRHRQRPARYFAQLRPQGRNGGEGEVRGPQNLPDLAWLVEPLLIVRRAIREQTVILHRRLLAIVRDDEVCRRLMNARCRPCGGANLPR